MRARTKISIALKASQFTEDQAELLAEELYNAVAHELAEDIRAAARNIASEDEGFGCIHEAADLIDPEVEK